MATRRFTIVLEFSNDDDFECTLPTEKQVESALAYSTASEALMEATGCPLSAWVADQSELAHQPI